MWVWWMRMPTKDFTDVILAIEDTDEDEDTDADGKSYQFLKWIKERNFLLVIKVIFW